MIMKPPRLVLRIVLAMLLAACAGGGTASTTLPGATSVTEQPVTTSPTSAPADDTSTTTKPPSTTLPEAPTVPTSAPKPTLGEVRGEIFVTGRSIVFLESDPVQVRLDVSAQLPTPCHEPMWDVDDDGVTITVDLYTTVDAEKICADVIQDAELQIDLGSFEPGETRTVVLNGEDVGGFTL